jgi:hypothetical protein
VGGAGEGEGEGEGLGVGGGESGVGVGNVAGGKGDRVGWADGAVAASGVGVGAGASIGTITSIKKNKPKVKSYPVNIVVGNKPEGAAFTPKVKSLQVSENPDSDILAEVIGIYSATDEDSGKPAENVQ